MDSVTAETQALTYWEKNAALWDESMGDSGNDYFRFLELPALARMIKVQRGNHALDLGTGNGLVARYLARENASVVAADGSPRMVELAQERAMEQKNIKFQVLDVTNALAWDRFISSEDAANGFDIITMNMAIMDIPDLKPLAVALRRLLTPTGSFAATILHPLFFTSGGDRQITVHENPITGLREIKHSIILTKYLKVPPARQLLFSKEGQPESPVSFHRPLHELFAPFFEEGLVLDALEEPNFDESFHEPSRAYSSKNFTEFPKILAFRLRLASPDA